MTSPILIICLSALALAQVHEHAQPPASKTAPRLGFVQTKDSSGVVDGDLLNAQKGMQDSGAAMHSMRDMHQAELTREFIQDFNDAKECDCIVLLGYGDNKADFALQIEVASHDTQGQQPVWHWSLRETRTNKPIPGGQNDSARQTARDVCVAVWNRVDPARLKQFREQR